MPQEGPITIKKSPKALLEEQLGELSEAQLRARYAKLKSEKAALVAERQGKKSEVGGEKSEKVRILKERIANGQQELAANEKKRKELQEEMDKITEEYGEETLPDDVNSEDSERVAEIEAGLRDIEASNSKIEEQIKNDEADLAVMEQIEQELHEQERNPFGDVGTTKEKKLKELKRELLEEKIKTEKWKRSELAGGEETRKENTETARQELQDIANEAGAIMREAQEEMDELDAREAGMGEGEKDQEEQERINKNYHSARKIQNDANTMLKNADRDGIEAEAIEKLKSRLEKIERAEEGQGEEESKKVKEVRKKLNEVMKKARLIAEARQDKLDEMDDEEYEERGEEVEEDIKNARKVQAEANVLHANANEDEIDARAIENLNLALNHIGTVEVDTSEEEEEFDGEDEGEGWGTRRRLYQKGPKPPDPYAGMSEWDRAHAILQAERKKLSDKAKERTRKKQKKQERDIEYEKGARKGRKIGLPLAAGAVLALGGAEYYGQSHPDVKQKLKPIEKLIGQKATKVVKEGASVVGKGLTDLSSEAGSEIEKLRKKLNEKIGQAEKAGPKTNPGVSVRIPTREELSKNPLQLNREMQEKVNGVNMDKMDKIFHKVRPEIKMATLRKPAYEFIRLKADEIKDENEKALHQYLQMLRKTTLRIPREPSGMHKNPETIGEYAIRAVQYAALKDQEQLERIEAWTPNIP